LTPGTARTAAAGPRGAAPADVTARGHGPGRRPTRQPQCRPCRLPVRPAADRPSPQQVAARAGRQRPRAVRKPWLPRRAASRGQPPCRACRRRLRPQPAGRSTETRATRAGSPRRADAGHPAGQAGRPPHHPSVSSTASGLPDTLTAQIIHEEGHSQRHTAPPAPAAGRPARPRPARRRFADGQDGGCCPSRRPRPRPRPAQTACRHARPRAGPGGPGRAAPAAARRPAAGPAAGRAAARPGAARARAAAPRRPASRHGPGLSARPAERYAGAFGRPGAGRRAAGSSKKQRRQEFDNMQAPSIGGVQVPRGNGQVIRLSAAPR